MKTHSEWPPILRQRAVLEKLAGDFLQTNLPLHVRGKNVADVAVWLVLEAEAACHQGNVKRRGTFTTVYQAAKALNTGTVPQDTLALIEKTWAAAWLAKVNMGSLEEAMENYEALRNPKYVA